MRAVLVPLEGGSPVEIAKDMTLVGRQEDMDIRIDHKSVSKVHCVLVKTDGLVLLRDLGSTNGTRVNGTRIRRAALLPNDKVSFANFHFRILFGIALASIHVGDQTQQIELGDLKKVVELAAAKADANADSDPDIAIVDVQRNVLPDVYPDERK